MKVLLPSQLADEATSTTADDWQVVQVNGENKLRKIRPGVLPPKSVGTAEIADKAVTRTQMADSTIQVLQLADNAVETVKIKDKAVTLAKLTDLSGYRLLGRPYFTAGIPVEVSCTHFAFTLLDADDAATARTTLAAMGTAGGTFTGTIQRTNGMYIVAPGAGANPVYAYQGDTNTGICFPSADALGFTTGGVGRAYFGSEGDFKPVLTGTYQLGTSALKWQEIWCTQTDINTTSDARAKTDIKTSDLGLDFILALRPVTFRWIVGSKRSVPPTDPDAPGARDTIVERPGVRPHYGLLAQQVKEVLGDRDFGGYVYDQEADAHALRYSEFIAPLIKAVQELTQRITVLEAALSQKTKGAPGDAANN